MRRIALFVVSTVAIMVLLFSYKTSWPAPSARPAVGAPAHLVSGPAVVTSNAVTTSAPPPDPSRGAGSTDPTVAATKTQTHPGAARSSVDPGTTAAPRTAVAPKTAASTTSNTAPVIADGSAVDTNYGPVQVEVTIANKRITKVTVPVYPSGSGRDAEINSYALPQLVAEVLSAQSATIDGVSGATYTSQGFQASLQSALDAANFGK